MVSAIRIYQVYNKLHLIRIFAALRKQDHKMNRFTQLRSLRLKIATFHTKTGINIKCSTCLKYALPSRFPNAGSNLKCSPDLENIDPRDWKRAQKLAVTLNFSSSRNSGLKMEGHWLTAFSSLKNCIFQTNRGSNLKCLLDLDDIGSSIYSLRKFHRDWQ